MSMPIAQLAFKLDGSGLVWHPEIGDEIADRNDLDLVSILVDPHGLTPSELRKMFLWLPTVEQLVEQFEARQAIIYHAGLNEKFQYEAVIHSASGVIEATAVTLRIAFASALLNILAVSHQRKDLH